MPSLVTFLGPGFRVLYQSDFHFSLLSICSDLALSIETDFTCMKLQALRDQLPGNKIATSFLALAIKAVAQGKTSGNEKTSRRRSPAFLFHSLYCDLSFPVGAGFGTFKKDSKVAVRLIRPVPSPQLSIACILLLIF